MLSNVCHGGSLWRASPNAFPPFSIASRGRKAAPRRTKFASASDYASPPRSASCRPARFSPPLRTGGQEYPLLLTVSRACRPGEDVSPIWAPSLIPCRRTRQGSCCWRQTPPPILRTAAAEPWIQCYSAGRNLIVLHAHQDRLGLGVGVDRLRAHLAPESGLLVATDGHDGIGFSIGVDPDAP